jgi:hypothetical protein
MLLFFLRISNHNSTYNRDFPNPKLGPYLTYKFFTFNWLVMIVGIWEFIEMKEDDQGDCLFSDSQHLKNG